MTLIAGHLVEKFKLTRHAGSTFLLFFSDHTLKDYF